MNNKIALVTAVSVVICCLLVVTPAKSDEHRFAWRINTSRQHSSILALDNISGRGMAIGIDARRLLRLMEMDPNVYVLYIGDSNEFESWIDGSIKATHITLKQIKENSLLFPKDKTLILICPSGQQSLVAAKILAERGLVVYYVIGGMKALNKLENHKPMLMKEKSDQENGKKTIKQKNDEQRHPESLFEEEDMGC